MKNITYFMTALFLNGCAGTDGFEVQRELIGYVPPPKETTIAEELKLEYDRCVKIGGDDNCAQSAFDVVRRVKGLAPRKVPKGVVIILKGDGTQYTEEQKKAMLEAAIKKAREEEKAQQQN